MHIELEDPVFGPVLFSARTIFGQKKDGGTIPSRGYVGGNSEFRIPNSEFG